MRFVFGNKKRFFASIFLVCYIFVFLLSGFFILERSHHEHDHDGIAGTCVTCAQIHNAENLLKQLNMAFFGAAVFIALSYVLAMILHVFAGISILFTPVDLKIRMNN